LLQHEYKVHFLSSSDGGKQQMGQSPRWLLSGCLNKISSRISAALFLHARLCCGLCSLCHLTLQYRTDLQAVHFFNFMSSTSAMPHEAQQHIMLPLSLTTSVLIITIIMTRYQQGGNGGIGRNNTRLLAVGSLSR
jgi:hypothetical protein